MKGIIGFVGLNAGGWLGWWLGAFHSLTLAVVLSAVGSGLGLYYVRKLADRFLES
jgi:hypothetical protein